MEKEDLIISVGNSYISKYYINPEFTKLPKEIQDKIQIMIVTLAEKTRGIVTLSYNDCGDIFLKVIGDSDDYDFDDINAQLELKRYEEYNKELLKGLIAYYKLFINEDGKELVKNLKPEDIDNLEF